MQLVDTHCHIHEADYPILQEQVIANANKVGVTRLICVGTTAESSSQAVQFVHNKPNMWASVGLHPHEAINRASAIPVIAKLCNQKNNKIVAIGECGLDYFYNHSPKNDQKQALRAQLDIAVDHNLPVIFHVRDAFDDFWPILAEYPKVRGVLHSFTDTQANVNKALERGLYIGISGIITFTKNQWQLDIAKAIPLQKILLETDAPFLTPAPLRGTINEPAHVSLVTTFLADLRGETPQQIAAATTANAQTLFNL